MNEEAVRLNDRTHPAGEAHVRRVVLWNIRPETSEAQIQGVEDVWSGVAMEADAPYRYFALIAFSSPEMVEVFNQHPLHARFGELYFNPVITDHYVADYGIQT
jgi:hypothetical protein